MNAAMNNTEKSKTSNWKDFHSPASFRKNLFKAYKRYKLYLLSFAVQIKLRRLNISYAYKKETIDWRNNGSEIANDEEINTIHAAYQDAWTKQNSINKSQCARNFICADSCWKQLWKIWNYVLSLIGEMNFSL